MLLKIKHKLIATYLAFFLIPLSGLITDMYLPSMPQMAKHFNQSEKGIQLTLTFFLVSYGISQFVTGTIMDSFGRRKFIIVSLFTFIISCLVIAQSNSIHIVYAMRILQGITAGFIVVAKRAFFVDVYSGEQQKKYLAAIGIIWAFAPIIAPFIGGYLQYYFNWQSVFYVLAAYGFVMLILEFIFTGETLLEKRNFNIKSIKAAYKQILADNTFTSMLFMFGLCYANAMLFSLIAPFVIEHVLNFSPIVTGYGSLLSGLAWLIGGLLNKALKLKSIYTKIKIANQIQIITIISMIISSYFIWNVFTLIIFTFLLLILSSLIYNNVFTFCLGRFPKLAGFVSGVCGGSNFIITSASSYGIIWLLNPITQVQLSWGYLILAILVFLFFNLVLKKNLTVNS